MTRRKHKTLKNQQQLAASHRAEPQAVVVSAYEGRLRPWLLGGMTALLVARPLFPSESAAATGDGLSVVMLWLALGVFWLLGAVGRPKFSLRLGWTDAAVLLLMVWIAVASFWAVARGTPRPAVNMLWEWVGMGLCFFLARQFIVTSRERRAVAAVMVALAVAISGYGLYQRSYEFPETRALYEANPDWAMRDAGQWCPPDSPDRKRFEDRLANTEPTATFALTNSLAAFLAPWLVMLAGIIAGGDSCRRTVPGRTSIGDGSRLLQYKRLLALFACLVPIAICLLLTKSRSGYAAACVGILLIWLFGRAAKGDGSIFADTKIGTVPWKLPAALAGIAVLLLSIALAVEGPAVLGRASKSFGYRLQYWQSTLQMIGEHPWVGCGPGNFQEAYTQYKLADAAEEIADPHNFFLEICATAGTPAALAFLAVLGCFVGGFRSRGAKTSANPHIVAEFRSEGVPPAPENAGGTPALRSSNAWLYVLGGGAAGFLLSWPIGVLSAAPPSPVPASLLGWQSMIPAPVLLGLPLAAATVVLMLGWIRDGRLPPWLPGACIVALLVDLLAAGGIAMPGIAATFWLLLALGLDGLRPHTFGTRTAWAALAGLLVLAVACYTTAYQPVLRCQAELRLAEREPAHAVEHLEAAAAADPLSAEPWRQLAGVEFEAWWRHPDKVAFSRFTRARDKAVELAPNSAIAWRTSGDWEFWAFSVKDQTGERLVGEAVQSAIKSYTRAVQLYPNSALYRAKLAEAHLAAGDRAAFRREAETALRLDQATPHEDQKLPAKLRDRLSRERNEIHSVLPVEGTE